MKQYTVDAFTDRIFHGNPAAVCVMDGWLPDETMQRIAGENNLSETAFAVRTGDGYHLRWFTPGGEIDLCGHATLAAAYVITRFCEPGADAVVFQTLSGTLPVRRSGALFEMTFPAYALTPVAVTEAMEQAVGAPVAEAFLGRDLLLVLGDAETVARADPDPAKLLALDGLLVHITARGTDCDCVSRSFAPKLGVAEDPVCGSGHCHIAPYWAGRLGKPALVAYQASRRGGTLHCRVEGDRVCLAGQAVLFAVSELCLP